VRFNGKGRHMADFKHNWQSPAWAACTPEFTALRMASPEFPIRRQIKGKGRRVRIAIVICVLIGGLTKGILRYYYKNTKRNRAWP